MKKKKALLIGLVLIVVIIAATCFINYISKYNSGVVTQISVVQKSNSTMDFQIDYLFPSGRYSVHNVPEDEGEYCGDGMTEYNGSLGKHRIMVVFGDLELADSFAKKLDNNGVFEPTDGVFAKVAYPSDHGFVLYIGSDKPISVEPLEHGKLNALGGTIKISIAIGNE